MVQDQMDRNITSLEKETPLEFDQEEEQEKIWRNLANES